MPVTVLAKTRKLIRFFNSQMQLEVARLTRASKEHSCQECGGFIRKGDYYISDKILRTHVMNRKPGKKPFRILKNPYWHTKKICLKCGTWFLKVMGSAEDDVEVGR